jgi:hypothetical protein
MDALLEASHWELPISSSHGCAEGKDVWAALTSSVPHGSFAPAVAGVAPVASRVLDLSFFGERPDTEGEPDGRDPGPPDPLRAPM